MNGIANTYSSDLVDGRSYWHTPTPSEIRLALSPLVERLRAYDKLRLKLEKKGGILVHVRALTRILTEEFLVKGQNGAQRRASLTNHESLRVAVLGTGSYDTYLQVRRLDTGMPVYYLCRAKHDYWSEYSLIVEDLYMSPGYPTDDERFIKVMYLGHETNFLRVSQFRDAATQAPNTLNPGASAEQAPIMFTKYDGGTSGAALTRQPTAGNPFFVSESQTNGDIRYSPAKPLSRPWADTTEDGADDLLYNVGRHVLQAAWHDDQRPGVLAANHFGLPTFRHAIELLYLCLSGELCELRSAVSPQMLWFFETAYPQPAIFRLVNNLTSLEGDAFNELPRTALRLYGRLSCAFGDFLRVEVSWSQRKLNLPLYKLIFGNFSRLAVVAAELRDNEQVRGAARELELVSNSVVEELLEKTSSRSKKSASGDG